MSASIIDTVSSNLEQVSPTAARYYDQSTSLAKVLKPSAKVSASRYLYRYPVIKYIGGSQVKYVANGGDMGRGTSLVMSALEFGFFDSSFNIEVTKEQMDYMQSNGSAMLDVLSEMLSNAFTEIDILDEIYLFGDGTGKLSNASSAITSTTMTFAGSTDTLGVNRLRPGMYVDVWDTTGATKRANGPFTITDIDYGNKVVTLSAAPTSLTATDLLAIAGADAYGPSTLTSFSSTWPGGGLSNADGLTGDSWRHGLGYVNDATTSNYYAGKLKSAFGQLLPTYVNGQASQLTFDHGELMKNLIIQRRDENVINDMMVVMHQCQVQQLKSAVTAVSVFQRTGGPADMIDLTPTGGIKSQFMFADIPAIHSKRQDRARVDGFVPGNWFRVEGHPTEFFKFDGGNQTIRARVNSSGNTTATYEIKVVQKMDTGCFDPGAGGYIGNLAVSSSY